MAGLDKVVLGTVQLGLPYGINNTQGMPTSEEAVEILSAAYTSGIRSLDTAEAYGFSQRVIGQYHERYPSKKFEVITKYASSKSTGDHLTTNVEDDLKELALESLNGYMFHNYGDYLNNKNRIYELTALKNKGIIKGIGVSVYTNEEIELIAEDETIDFVQLPFNLFDNNNLRASSMKKLRGRNKEVHVRSVFLQGLFYKSADSLPGKLAKLSSDLNKIQAIAKSAESSVSALALAYVLRNDFIDKVLIGVDNQQQLKDNIAHINNSGSISDLYLDQINAIHISDKELLNPVNW